MTMTYGDKSITTPLLTVFRLPIVGTQYQMTPVEDMETIINENIEALVDINERIGYLVSHGTHMLSAGSPMGGPASSPLGTFMTLLGDNYSIKRIDLKEDQIPASLKVLIIVRPTERFTDFDLFQIDQALMRGTRLILFLDAIGESRPPGGQQVFRQSPQFETIQTGLERLLASYGISIRPSIVLDENCYRQRLRGDMGGGDRPIYYAPLIQSAHINTTEPYLQNIRGLIALKMSPLELDAKRLQETGIQATRLFSSSPQSWEMRERITLDPMAIGGPPPPEDQQQFHLAYLLEGPFTSYFAGQAVPEKPAPEETSTANADAGAETDIEDKARDTVDLSGIDSSSTRRDQGEPSKILVIGSSDIVQDNILDAGGRSPNAMFIMNVIDALSDRVGVAEMRSKEQRFNPLDETATTTRTMTKAFNVIGVPLVVVVFGLLVWLQRTARKKRIQSMFEA